jgi:hypothetical protein
MLSQVRIRTSEYRQRVEKWRRRRRRRRQEEEEEEEEEQQGEAGVFKKIVERKPRTLAKKLLILKALTVIIERRMNCPKTARS